MSSPRHPEDASTPPPPNSDAVNHEANPPPSFRYFARLWALSGRIMLLSWSTLQVVFHSNATGSAFDLFVPPLGTISDTDPYTLLPVAADDTIFRSDGGDGYSYSLDDPQVITPTRCTQFKRGRSDLELEWGEVMKRSPKYINEATTTTTVYMKPETSAAPTPIPRPPTSLAWTCSRAESSSSTGDPGEHEHSRPLPHERGRIEALTEGPLRPHRATNSRSVGALASLVAAAEHILQPRAPLSVLPKPPIPYGAYHPIDKDADSCCQGTDPASSFGINHLSILTPIVALQASNQLPPTQLLQPPTPILISPTPILLVRSASASTPSSLMLTEESTKPEPLADAPPIQRPVSPIPPIPSTGTSSSSHRQVATLRQPSLLTLILASNDGIDSGCRVLDASAYIIQSLESSRAEVPASTFAYDDVHLNVDAVHLQRVGFGLSFPMESLVDLVKLALADTAIAQFVPLQVEEFYACLERDIDTRQNGELRRLVPRAFDQLGDELMGSSYTSQSPDTVIKIPTAAHSFDYPPPNDSAISIRQTQFGAGLGRPAVTASLLTTTTTTTPPQPPPPSTILLVMRGSPPATGRPVDAKRLKQSITSPHLFWEARCIDQNHHHYYFRLSQKTAPIQVSIETTKRVHAKGYEDSRCLSPSRADLSP
ncbi:hypothetical protein BKA70DRAFT_1441137 [Coprinopsis sp. MPI-PUGE-AT-0042]|nr:hypothetical protein BKA70DRAFT_1441137 [Coprinopsis sp. MPI-PUGE-AT-0042]